MIQLAKKLAKSVQQVNFGLFLAYVIQTDQSGKTYSVPLVAYYAKPNDKSFKIIAEHTFNDKNVSEEISNLKDQINNASYEFDQYPIHAIKDYYDMVVTQEDYKNASYGKAYVPALSVNRNSIQKNIVDIFFFKNQPTQPQQTEPEPTPQPTQAPTQPQPTVAPVHPQQPNKPGSNVKPKPEKPAAPNHHTNQHNNNSGSIKPKAQKMPGKAPLNKSVKRAKTRIPEAAHTTTQTVAPKAQTPTVKKAAKAVLPQTGENNSLSKAAILLGGAAAVIGLIGLAATRKHIF